MTVSNPTMGLSADQAVQATIEAELRSTALIPTQTERVVIVTVLITPIPTPPTPTSTSTAPAITPTSTPVPTTTPNTIDQAVKATIEIEQRATEQAQHATQIVAAVHATERVLAAPQLKADIVGEWHRQNTYPQSKAQVNYKFFADGMMEMWQSDVANVEPKQVAAELES